MPRPFWLLTRRASASAVRLAVCFAALGGCYLSATVLALEVSVALREGAWPDWSVLHALRRVIPDRDLAAPLQLLEHVPIALALLTVLFALCRLLDLAAARAARDAAP